MMMSKYTLCTRVCKEKKEKYILKNLHTMYKGVQEKKVTMNKNMLCVYMCDKGVHRIHSNMKFKVNKISPSVIDGIQNLRTYNQLQMPEIGVEYEVNNKGLVVNMSARVVYENEQWMWYPEQNNLTGSYYFRSVPFIIDITKT